jgi:hypothetical protein
MMKVQTFNDTHDVTNAPIRVVNLSLWEILLLLLCLYLLFH